jgi:hypothetical protein
VLGLSVNEKQECLYHICETIYNLRECIDTWNFIADNANRIDEKYGLFFGTLQCNNLDLAILYIGKLFDKHRDSSSICYLLGKTQDEILGNKIVMLNNILTHRDKRVAHAERNAVQKLKDAKIRWQDFQELGDLAEQSAREYSRENNLAWLNAGCISSAMANLNVMAVLLNIDTLELQILHRLRNEIKTTREELKPLKEFIYNVFDVAIIKNHKIEMCKTNYKAQIDFGHKKLHEEHIQKLYPKALEDSANISKLIEEVAAGRPCTHKPMKEIIMEIKNSYL